MFQSLFYWMIVLKSFSSLREYNTLGVSILVLLDDRLKEHFFILHSNNTTFAIFLQPLYLSFLYSNNPFSRNFQPLSAHSFVSTSFANHHNGNRYILTPEIRLKKNGKHLPNISLYPSQTIKHKPSCKYNHHTSSGPVWPADNTLLLQSGSLPLSTPSPSLWPLP